MAESRPCKAYDFDDKKWKPATWLAWSVYHEEPCAIVEWPNGRVTYRSMDAFQFVQPTTIEADEEAPATRKSRRDSRISAEVPRELKPYDIETQKEPTDG